MHYISLSMTTLPDQVHYRRIADPTIGTRKFPTIWKQSTIPVANPSATDANANIQMPDAKRVHESNEFAIVGVLQFARFGTLFGFALE